VVVDEVMSDHVPNKRGVKRKVPNVNFEEESPRSGRFAESMMQGGPEITTDASK